MKAWRWLSSASLLVWGAMLALYLLGRGGRTAAGVAVTDREGSPWQPSSSGGFAARFGNVVALDHLDLEIHSGEFVSLLGPSGCGKTTALRIIAGFEWPDSGEVLVDGHDVLGMPANRRNMGMVFQAYSLFPNLTAQQNVEFGLRVRKQSHEARSRRARELLELVGLGEAMGRYPRQLSGGQQQRVALARSIAIQPSVLLLDEPLSALDAKVRVQLREEVRRIQLELGITTLYVTHDQEEALSISDRVAVMSQGRVEQLGTPAQIYSGPRTAFVANFVGTMNKLEGTVVVGLGPDSPHRAAPAEHSGPVVQPSGRRNRRALLAARGREPRGADERRQTGRGPPRGQGDEPDVPRAGHPRRPGHRNRGSAGGRLERGGPQPRRRHSRGDQARCSLPALDHLVGRRSEGTGGRASPAQPPWHGRDSI